MTDAAEAEPDAGAAEPKPDFSVLRLPIEPGAWRDADDRMFEACFAILGQYVERELGTEPWDFMGGEEAMHRGYRLHSADVEEGDPSGMPPAPSSDRKAVDLWLWYRDELPALEAEYDAEVARCFGGDGVMRFGEPDERGLVPCEIVPRGEMRFPHDWPETVKDQKLRELIDLRRCLWT